MDPAGSPDDLADLGVCRHGRQVSPRHGNGERRSQSGRLKEERTRSDEKKPFQKVIFGLKIVFLHFKWFKLRIVGFRRKKEAEERGKLEKEIASQEVRRSSTQTFFSSFYLKVCVFTDENSGIDERIIGAEI